MKQTLILIGALVVAACASNIYGADATENWQKHCAKCHGPDGKGETKMGRKAGVKDMTSAEYQAHFKDENALKAVKEGLKENGQEKMKPNALLSDDEIKALIAHVRTFKK